VHELAEFFMHRLQSKAVVYAQSPIAIDAASEPQPDLMLIKPPKEKYRAAHPGPSDVLLVVEVADSSLRVDLDEKMRLYARAGIAEYWVVDLVRGAVLAHHRPKGDAYEEVVRHAAADSLAPRAFPDAALPLSDLFA
jgi:Uma2 family endonuclease